MELKKHLCDLQKIKGINTQFQKKLGEITIWLNGLQCLNHIPNDSVVSFISSIQGFLCHNYYLEYNKTKASESTLENKNCSTYDNCMNLILIISAKIAKINPGFGTAMIDTFIEHVNSHLECFNYIISFYRLYITCPQIKQCGKTYGICNNLFLIYKQIHKVTEAIEPQYKIKNLKALIKPGDSNFKWINSSIDKKYLFENYLQLTDRPNNSSNPNVDLLPLNNQFKSDFAIHTKSSNSGINIQSNKLNSQFNSNTNINTNNNNNNNNRNSNNLFNGASGSVGSSGINSGLSRTERKNINIRLSSDMQQNTAEISLNLKEVPKTLKAKIPMLKFPVDKTQPQHRYSIIRSSHRADFSKSGDGSSTSTTKNNKMKFPSKKEVVLIDNSVNRNYTKELAILEPKDKLKLLAIQLGESCLAAGLAALIHQKREMELGKIKQNAANSNLNLQYNSNNQSCSSSQKSPKISKYIEKLKSNEMEIDINDELYYDTPNNKWNSKRSSKNFCNKSDNCIEKDKSSYSIQSQNQNVKTFQKIREILSNFILTCLKEYSIEDFNYLKINVNVIYSYLILPSLEMLKSKFDRKCIEMMENMKDYKQIESYVGDGNLIYQSDFINKTIQKIEIIHAIHDAYTLNDEYGKIVKQKKDKTIFESFLSITFEEDNTCPLALKSEYTALYEILQMFSTNIENEVKKQHFFSSLFVPSQNSIREFITNGICFSSMNIINVEILRKHIDPFVDLIRHKICFILKSYDLSGFYSSISIDVNNNNNGSSNNVHTPNTATNNNNNSTDDDNYIMRIIKQQLDILTEYLNMSKSRIITSHLLIHLSDMLIILKKIYIQLILKFDIVDSNYCNGSNSNNNNNSISHHNYNQNAESKSAKQMSHNSNSNNNTQHNAFNSPNQNILNSTNNNANLHNITQEITERIEIKIPDKLIESYTSFINLISSLIDHATLPFEHKFLNETFIICPIFSEVNTFMFKYFLNSNLSKDRKREKSNTNRGQSNKNNLIQILKDGVSQFNDSLIESFKTNAKYALIWIDYYYNCNLFYHKIIKELNIDKSIGGNGASTGRAIGGGGGGDEETEKDQKKYWTGSIKEHTLTLQKFLNSKNGCVFDLFINTTGAGFLFSKIKLSIIFTHFNLIRGLLNLQQSTLEFPSKYSSLVNEMTSFDYIRLHYISFIKLYNKNIIFNPNLNEVSTIIANCEKTEKKKTLKAFVKDVNNDQNLLNIIIILCKMHLKCLYSLAKNRNIDVTNKFCQLRIVDYMTKELDLEHEAAEKIYKFNKFNSIASTAKQIEDKRGNNQFIINESSNNKSNVFGINRHKPKTPSDINLQLNFEGLVGHEEEKEKKVIIEKLEFGQEKECSANNSKENNDDNKDKDKGIDNGEDNDQYDDISDEDMDINSNSSYSDDKDLDNILLVEPSLKKHNYDMVPKLSLNPNPMGDNNEGYDHNDKDIKHANTMSHKLVNNLKGEGQFHSLSPNPQQSENNLNFNNAQSNTINANNDTSNKPKIQLKLNLNLCKSTKNDKLKEILHEKEQLKDIPTTNGTVNVNVGANENQSQGQTTTNQPEKPVHQTIQLPQLQMLNIQKSPIKTENVSIDISKDNNNTNLTNQLFEKNQLEQQNSKLLASKIQVEIERHLKQKYNLFYQKALTEGLNEQDFSNVSQFYLKERNSRLLYQDPELQVLIISIIICLIITPSRGTLEELYCSVFSYENNKMNVLYILHHHLNRTENELVLPLLLKYCSQILPYGAGQRLLKLLCTKFFDPTMYTNWDKIAGGQFGTVYQSSTNLSEPEIVAIKKIELEQNIFSPCRLFDIFTEITALETFRLENCVTQLYDYGCDKESYYIVMKRYPQSLKDWRIKQKSSLSQMLPTYLGIFKDILEAVRIIHNKNTTHYDLKCDNIMLDFLLDNTNTQAKDNKYSFDTSPSENSICIRVADFGECRIFLNDQDEYCTRSRGTDVIKSPEMLKHNGYQVCTDDDNFDRRKKRGTTRSSDIWSLGCLFYELLTGNFLFEEIAENYVEFMCNVDQKSIDDLLTEKKLTPLESNTYIIDFLKFMLEKSQTYRPNIEAVIEHFGHVCPLVVGGTGFIPSHILSNYEYFESCLEQCESMLIKHDKCIPYAFNVKSIPNIIQLTSDVYCSDYSYAENNCSHLFELGITHIISWTKTRNREINEKFYFLNIVDNYDIENPHSLEHLSLFNYIFKTIDFLRHCMIYKGKVLFIDDYLYTNVSFKDNFFMRSLILLIFSFLLNQNAYDTWTYLNSKLLFFNIPKEILGCISQWVLNQNLIFNYLSLFPIVSCLCGGCQIVLNRNNSNQPVKKCVCQYGQINQQYSDCPSNGCFDYISSMKSCYDVYFDSLHWLSVSAKDFYLGPGEMSTITNPNAKRIALFSRGLEENLIEHSINDKYSIKVSGRKNTWIVYKCKICQCWLYGESNEKIQLLMNNASNYNKKLEQRRTLVKSNHLKQLNLRKLI